MNVLLQYSLENKSPIELIYMNNAGNMTQRKIIVRQVKENRVLAYDLRKQQLRTFKLENILSVDKQRRRLNYA
ncbi:WYL domain-containing protein (plasmid) [Rossellomorea sp. AcN35-11]|nr:WYL domain-containing protein [Rossellomorea aquimaris]WJV32023.1 WYL domain-containing protein [Rossellomorea sp. AcN35-11]